MEYRELGNTGLRASVIGLGTWVMGGWMWGGAEDRDSLATIRRAIELGINLIDTAPIYGHGRSEELVGRALAESGLRSRVILATKVGLEWNQERTKVWRNSSQSRIACEVEDSLKRLRTDVITSIKSTGLITAHLLKKRWKPCCRRNGRAKSASSG